MRRLSFLSFLFASAMVLAEAGNPVTMTKDFSVTNLTTGYGVASGLFASGLINKTRGCIVNRTSTQLYGRVGTAALCAVTVLSGHAGATSAAAATVSTGFTQPDVPSVIKVATGGTTGDVESCVVTLAGTNEQGTSITDTVTFAANDNLTRMSTKVFKTISSVSWAASCESGGFAATWTLTLGDSFPVPASGNACFDVANMRTNVCLRSSSGTLSANGADLTVW